MTPYQARSKQNRGGKKISLVWFLVALFVVLFMARGVYGVWQKNQVSEENLAVMEEKLAELKDRKKDLEYKVELLKTDRGMEEAFRESLPVAKPGEKVIIIVGDNEETINEKEPTGWRRFWPF